MQPMPMRRHSSHDAPAWSASGYRVVRESGHLIMSNGERRLVIPRHDPINAITMGAIARDAGLTPQQFRDLL
jgi:hypothetical protein